jgi:hypothetical protein
MFLLEMGWSGSMANSFDVFRDGNLVESNLTENALIDDIGLKGSRIYQNQVSQAGSLKNRSNFVDVIFKIVSQHELLGVKLIRSDIQQRYLLRLELCGIVKKNGSGENVLMHTFLEFPFRSLMIYKKNHVT